MIHAAKLVHCRDHGEACCYLQCDGSHVSKRDCKCAELDGYLCPIDAHSIKWLLEHPEFEDEIPRKLEAERKPKPHECPHRGAKVIRELPGGIRSWVCRTCERELNERLGEVKLPPTPIELYAQTMKSQPAAQKRGEKMTTTGCNYNVGKRATVVNCCLICEVGQTMCPRHVAIFAAQQKEKQWKEDEKIERQKQKERQKREAAEQSNNEPEQQGVNA